MKTTVYSMYRQEDTDNTDVFPLIASFVASGFGFGSGLEGATTGLFEDLLTGAAAVPSPADAEVPKAYLKYFIFNREMQMTQHGHVLLDETALNNWQKLELEIPIQTNGYIYIYVANESMADVNVHFDDMEVILIEGPAVNGADYYPFGLAMEGRNWSSEGYRFGYQGQFAEKDDETSWNYFEARMWNSEIGRWMVPDPVRQYYSPYLGMGNAPTYKFDPDGRCDDCPDPKTMEIGSTYIFDSAGPHAGAEYTLSSNGWVRTDLPMMNEVVVMPGVGQKVNDFFTNTVINPFVDVPTTLWTTTRNGYYQWWIEDVKGGSIYTDPEYNEWYSYTLGNDWSFHRNVDKYGINRNNNIESDPQRAVEIISNTASVTITTTFAVPSLQLSSKPGINLLLNFGVKNAGKGAVMYPINKGLETQR